MIWQIITAVAGALSAIAAMIACILTYRTTRPKVQVTINKIYLVERCGARFAMADIVVANKSSVQGTVSDLYLYTGRHKQKVKCEAELEKQIYDMGPLRIDVTANGIPAKDNRLKLPVSVAPFQVIDGYIIFPNLPDTFKIGNFVRIFCQNTNDIFIFSLLRSKRRKYPLKESKYGIEYARADSPQNKPDGNHNIDNHTNQTDCF